MNAGNTEFANRLVAGLLAFGQSHLIKRFICFSLTLSLSAPIPVHLWQQDWCHPGTCLHTDTLEKKKEMSLFQNAFTYSPFHSKKGLKVCSLQQDKEK